MNNYIGISEARANLPDIVDKVSEHMVSYIITVSGKPKAVVISFEELESIMETAEIMAIPGAIAAIKKGKEDARRGKGIPLAKVKNLLK